MAKPILSDNMEKAPTKSNLSITSNHINIELSKEFLVELRKNIYQGTYNEDVVDHIAKNGGLVREMEKSPLGRNLLRNSSVDSILNRTMEKMKLDGRTQKVIFHSWMNGNWNKRYVDNSISRNNEWKESKYENPSNTATDSFFKAYDNAKKLLEAVKKRFGGNAATRKTQRNLLKQQYENFTAPSLEMLDQIFDRLQKLMSPLELLDEKLSQEDVNQKLLRSLSP
ncbi:hypothetical protein Tco_0811500 [Tanacetum coccineum]